MFVSVNVRHMFWWTMKEEDEDGWVGGDYETKRNTDNNEHREEGDGQTEGWLPIYIDNNIWSSYLASLLLLSLLLLSPMLCFPSSVSSKLDKKSPVHDSTSRETQTNHRVSQYNRHRQHIHCHPSTYLPPDSLNRLASKMALWNTFTTLVPSAADTKKNGRLCLDANLNSFLVTL